MMKEKIHTHEENYSLKTEASANSAYDIAALLQDVDVDSIPAIHNSRNPLMPLRQALTIAEELSS